MRCIAPRTTHLTIASRRAGADNAGKMPATTHPSPAQPREPQLLRFRLRQMFLLVTVVGVLCGLMVLTDGPVPMLIGLAALLVAAHILGNLIGTRLRDTSQQVRLWRAGGSQAHTDEPRICGRTAAAARPHLPPGSPLANHGSVTCWVLWFVSGGLLLGAVVGLTAIACTIGPHIGWPGWAVGTISCAVLGAWAAFLASSFSSIARHAWREAEERGK